MAKDSRMLSECLLGLLRNTSFALSSIGRGGFIQTWSSFVALVMMIDFNILVITL